MSSFAASAPLFQSGSQGVRTSRAPVTDFLLRGSQFVVSESEACGHVSPSPTSVFGSHFPQQGAISLSFSGKSRLYTFSVPPCVIIFLRRLSYVLMFRLKGVGQRVDLARFSRDRAPTRWSVREPW